MKNSFSTKSYKKHIHFTSDIQSKKYKITREYLPNLNQNNQIPLNINFTREDLFKKDLCILDQIWDELEITYQYREAFSIYLRNMNEENRNNIIFQEKNYLKKYKKALINLKKEILIREDNILLLKRYNNRLENFNNNDQIANVFEDVINLVKKLRKNAINIVKEYSRIEEISKNYSNLEKVNKKIIKTEYSYDPNYIHKMQDDLLFLKESTLSKYFEMDNKYIDPFLTNFCSSTNDTNKKTVPNTNEILGLINESRYTLIQKKIFDKISQNNHKESNSEVKCFKTLSRNLSTKLNKKIEYKKDDKKENKLEKYLNHLKKNCPNRYTQLFVLKKNNLCDFSNIKKQIHGFHKEIKSLSNISNVNIMTKIKEESIEFIKHIKTTEQSFKIFYFTGDINDFIKIIKDKFPLNKIPQINKNIFHLNDSIYKKEFYFKGTFPKILIISSEENRDRDKNDIIGFCPFYYEWNEEPKYLNLKINYIISNDNNNYEKYIEKIINFIKLNAKFDRIEIKLIKDDSTNYLLDFFKNNLNFKWLNVQKNQKEKFQTMSLYFESGKLKDSTDIFILNNKSILTLDNKEKVINESRANPDEKFINKNNIYYMISENKDIKYECPDESKLNEITDIKSKLENIYKFENNYKIKEDNDIKTYLDENALNEMNDNGILCKSDLKINFGNIYSVILNNIYYNKISDEQMQIYQDENTKAIFFLIPTRGSPFSINICEMNSELKNLLINNNPKNIYEKFLEINKNTNIKLLKQAKKSLYIPSFILKKHFISKDFVDISKDIKLVEESTNTPLYLSSVNEFIDAEFKTDMNLKNNFVDNENNEYNNDYIIKDDFIIGIFRNDIIKDKNLTLIQLLYIEKKNFIIKGV